MKNATSCPKCGSDKIIPRVRIIDRYDTDPTKKSDLELEVYQKPSAWIFKGTKAGALQASVCGACGYVELFVENPAELYAVYEQAKEN